MAEKPKDKSLSRKKKIDMKAKQKVWLGRFRPPEKIWCFQDGEKPQEVFGSAQGIRYGMIQTLGVGFSILSVGFGPEMPSPNVEQVG